MSATTTPKPVLVQRYLPTYRLESQSPFDKDECEKLIKTIVDLHTESIRTYEADEAESLSKTLSEEILRRVKKIFFDRYKFICLVTIGEKYMQSYCDIFKCLWDMQKDGFAFYVYDTPNLFVVATLFAVYCD